MAQSSFPLTALPKMHKSSPPCGVPTLVEKSCRSSCIRYFAAAAGFTASRSNSRYRQEPPLRLWRRHEHDLAGVLFGEEFPLCGDDLAERMNAGDDGADFAALDIADEISEHLRLEHGTADEPQILEIQRTQIEGHDGSRDRACHRIFAAAHQHVEQRRKLSATDDVDDRIDRFRAEARDQIGVARKHAGGAQRFHWRSPPASR